MGIEFISGGQESVLLLDTEPWDLLWAGIEDWLGSISEVGLWWDESLVGSVFPAEGFGQNKDVVSSSEWIWENGDWFDDDLRVLSWGHVAWGSIEVPVWKLTDVVDLGVECSGLASEVAGSINPNVLGDNLSLLVEVIEECALGELLLGLDHGEVVCGVVWKVFLFN